MLKSRYQTTLIISALLLLSCAGCQFGDYRSPPPPTPLGTYVDAGFQKMEENAEMSDFVLYECEFKMNQPVMNRVGRDHLKQIAMRLRCGDDLPVVVERSMTAVDPDTEYKYPVNPNPMLDSLRRDLIVQSLFEMGIADASQRVVVAESYAEGMEAYEAAAIYAQGMNYGARQQDYGGGSLNGGGAWGPFSGW